MRVLVTGHAGFIGSHIAGALHDAGHRVTGVDVADPYGPLDAREFFAQDASRFDAVVHCAAVVGGRRVIEWTPVKHAQNLAIDAALFEWAERTKPGRVVYFSSSCAYPIHLAHQKRRLLEDDITWPPSPGCWPDELYGWTKLTGELLARTARAAGVAVSVVRPFSVYGPGMKEGFAVRGFMEQVQRRADPVEIWGNDQQTRDFIHVSDVAAAVLAIIREGVDGPVNLGTGRATTLRELAVMMTSAAGYLATVKTDPGMPAGVPRLVAGNELLRSFCPPKVTLESYLRGMLG